MPSLVPKARHEPPTWADHVVIHAVLVAVTAGWIAYMVLLLVGLFVGYGALSSSYSPMGNGLTSVMAAMIILGSVLTLWGITTSSSRLDRAWRAHQSGLVLVGGGWVIYTVAYAAMPGAFWFSIVIGFVQFIIALAGFLSVLFVERVTREAIRDQGIDA